MTDHEEIQSLKREVGELKRDLSKLQSAITGLPEIGDRFKNDCGHEYTKLATSLQEGEETKT